MDISKHPLIKQCYELCLVIEKCGASPELTDAVTRANEVMQEVEIMCDVLSRALLNIHGDTWREDASRLVSANA